IGGAPSAPSPQAAPVAASPPAPAPTTLAGGWSPSSIKSVGQSGKILDALNGVVTVDTDAEGNALVAAYGKTTLHLYRVKGTEIVPFTRISKPLDHHILNVHAMDIDGDGTKEILVTDLVNETVASFVLKKKGDMYQEVAEGIRYFLAVLPDWMGKPVLVGQYQGMDTPFQGKIVALRWDGKGFAEGEKFPQDTNILPLSSGLPGLSSARFGQEWRLIYTDANSNLRVLDSGGKSQYRSSGQYGSTPDLFEWGPIIPIEGHRKWYPVRNAVRVAAGGGEAPLVLIPEVKQGLLNMSGSTRLVLLHWERGEFVEKAGTQSSGRFLTGADFLSPDGVGKGGKIVASEIEQSGSAFTDKISRLLLYQAE
ncbi:MAG TPA: VCBS repeat-containing protein, partial [Candidatus Deferrimicrobium sp.]|nr:VCBS repeat-containing protein [Candidatus Deferrimicrobium sp.]